jgi:tRNA G46 methylase TrmB
VAEKIARQAAVDARGFFKDVPGNPPAAWEIHFKTDNADLFEFSLEQFRENGYELTEVTRDLHKDGPNGVMTDYELKFHEQGVSICRCVATLKI